MTHQPADAFTSIMDTATVGLVQARAYRTLNREFGAYLQEYNLSLSEWAVLGQLTDGTILSQVEIAEILDVTPAMATKLSAGLEAQGYAERCETGPDSRVKQIGITAHGQALVNKVEPVLRGRMVELVAGISRADLLAYIRVITALSIRK